MEFTSPKPDAGPAPAATPAMPASSPILDELRAIDTTALAQLLEVRQEQSRLADLRRRAEERKSGVKDAVLRRVLADYQTRADALDARARPLVVQVRTGYTALRGLMDRVSSARDRASLEKDELEFRHSIGELTDADLASRVEGSTRELEQCGLDASALDAEHARFLDALGGEAAAAPEAVPDVTPPPLPPPPPPAQAPASEPAAKTTAHPVTTFMPPDMAELVAPNLEDMYAQAIASARSGAPRTSHASLDETAPMPPMSPDPAPAGETRIRGAAPKPGARTIRDEAGEAPTFMLLPAALVVTPRSGSPVEYRLAALNTLGRSEDTQIQISAAGVSRRHAQVVATTTGFVLMDLQSQNGTFVNGQRITEWTLSDGDRVTIGDVDLVYRTLK
jgi:hypothetical protein